MEDMSKNFKSIENGIARYIYKKYIMPKNIIEEQAHSKGDVDVDMDMDIDMDMDMDMDEDSIIEDSKEFEDAKKDITDADSVVEINEEEKIDKKFDNNLYKLYLQRIFDLERHSFRILQEDVLTKDLKNMAIADKAYELNPKKFNPMEYDSLPDVLRCSFIRKYKHRYYRCKNKIINDDSDICKKHENCENIYIDRYNELLDAKKK